MNYEEPKFEIVEFEEIDIITSSGCDGDEGHGDIDYGMYC